MTFPEIIHPHWKLPHAAMKTQLLFSNDQVTKLSEGGTKFSWCWPLQDWWCSVTPGWFNPTAPVWGSCSTGDDQSGWHNWNNLGKRLAPLHSLWGEAKAEIQQFGVSQTGRWAISSCIHHCLCCKLISVSPAPIIQKLLLIQNGLSSNLIFELWEHVLRLLSLMGSDRDTVKLDIQIMKAENFLSQECRF